ncbi:hypothetical protein PACTADRAFT_51877 [Pachysolen tannophilus NRRL Y-2460]|uniref:Uncharacterized protein n=1 Tax=Pachysolen tannophilus NRRL Y-2460 TaxID=669874 RepID=A0A1E4TNG8_PACTA|nr:hypothetical protein PACTADRAFT_51877 [Pachysolen tannophilus NRRL Y-2460]
MSVRSKFFDQSPISSSASPATSAVSTSVHKLPYSWTIWHHSKSKAKAKVVFAKKEARRHFKTAESNIGSVEGDNTFNQLSNDSDQYLQSIDEIKFPKLGNSNELISNIDTVEQLWISMSNLEKIPNLKNGTQFLIFKTGVKPIWEDPINSKGGRWILRFSRVGLSNSMNDTDYKKRVGLIWERLVLRTCGGSLFSAENKFCDYLYDDITGMTLSIKQREIVISVWNSNLYFDKFQKQERENESKEKTNSSADENDFEFKENVTEDDAEESSNSKENKTEKLIPFSVKRAICDSLLRVVRECDSILNSGSDVITTVVDAYPIDRVPDVSFDYRLHSESVNPTTNNLNGKDITKSTNTNSTTSTNNYLNNNSQRSGGNGNNNNNNNNNHNSHYNSNGHYPHNHHHHHSGNSKVNSHGNNRTYNRRYNNNNNNNNNNSNALSSSNHTNHNGNNISSNGNSNSNTSGKHNKYNKEEKDFSSKNNGTHASKQDSTEDDSKSLFANLGRRRRGIENSVEGGEPSGMLSFAARRKVMQQQAEAEK